MFKHNKYLTPIQCLNILKLRVYFIENHNLF